MSVLQAFQGWVDDHINPIVIKELRQAVRGRFLSGVLILFLLIQIVTLGVTLVSFSFSHNTNFTEGRDYFSALLFILLGTCLLFIPAYTGFRMGSERTDHRADLLFITTLSPRAVITGKLTSSLLLVLLVYSAAFPFMTISFLLRGIDLPTIFSMASFSFLSILLAVQWAIFLGSLPLNRAARLGANIFILGSSGMIFISTLTTSFSMMYFGIGSYWRSWQFWLPAISTMLITLMIVGLLFALSITALTPSTANRAYPIRVFSTISYVLTAAFTITSSFLLNDMLPVAAWGVSMSMLLFISAFVSVSERKKHTHRVLRTIPQSPLKRTFAFLFYSGSAGGLSWTLCLYLLTAGMMGLTLKMMPYAKNHSDAETLILVCIGLAGFAFAYGLTGQVLKKMLFPKLREHLTWLLALLVAVIALVIPPIVGLLLGFIKQADGYLFLMTPFIFFEKKYVAAGAIAGGIWGTLAIFWSLPGWLKQFRSFKRSEKVSTPPKKVVSQEQAQAPETAEDAQVESGEESEKPSEKESEQVDGE
ncbi:MAG: hypothetical protein CL920_20405 [Deltaproteobacteria bacterium]|nr:hypothetical protein [Deltaproteobacteria bacterium]MBU51055.1 hypothetical protein [Deltaproteobacteria bacterium]